MSDVEQASTGEAPAKAAGDPVKRWTLVILASCVLLLAWHLRADRTTPYTSQARLHALVVPIAPEASGTITEVMVSNNQPVSSGQVLFQLDRSRYELAVQAAEASLEAARQAVGAAQANVTAARAGVQTALANEDRSRDDFERMRRIREEDPGAISERRLESAEAALKVSSGQVASARAALERALEDLGQEGERNSRILQARASLEQARIDLENTTVRAPDDGVVTGMRLDVGAFVAAGHAQMTFIATHRAWVQADFTENNLGHIVAGDAVDLVFDALPGRVFRGRVREVAFGVDVNTAPLGSLPNIRNDRQWLRDAQRFPVLVDLDPPLDPSERRLLKVGSQVSAIVYTEGHGIMNALGWLQIRLASLLTYAY